MILDPYAAIGKRTALDDTQKGESFNLITPEVQRMLGSMGLEFEKIYRKGDKRGNKFGHIDLKRLLKQRKGIFLFEYIATRRDSNNSSSEAHTICVNCTDRWVFCNLLGYGSFSMKNFGETIKTHADLASHFHHSDTRSIYALCPIKRKRTTQNQRKRRNRPFE